ncbi:MAG: VCBS repeat-containing protein [Rhizobacter sp.]|nr:VCBS repeat-containing protein [Bacteriovorax sp.]
MTAITERFKTIYFKIDARYTVTLILLIYNILGITVLGFNRSWNQILLTVATCVLLHIFYDVIFNKKFYFPLSAVTTSLGLCILVNYGHSMIYTIVPVYFAISSKFFFNFRGRHTFNPAMMGVALSLLIASEVISSSPAYQWNGAGSMALVIVMSALLFFMPKINRGWLVGTFLIVFTLQITLRSILIRHYLPFNTLFFGTITSPSFFLFTFFMITDPMTSPSDKNQQIIVGASLALLDLVFHLFSSYHTFFFAAFTLGSIRLTWFHFKAMRTEGGFPKYFRVHFWESRYYIRFFTILGIAFGSYFSYQHVFKDTLNRPDIGFNFELQPASKTGMHFTKGEVLDLVDPRAQHMGKWILAITDGIAVGDFDNDGLVDVFFTSGHKSPADRNAFFKNTGNFNFQRMPSPELTLYASDIKKYGIPSNAMFVDYDNDGDLDLFVTYAFGREGTSRMFKNMLKETGKATFVNVTDEEHLNVYSNAATANFLDFNGDGLLDLIVGNTIATHLPDYKTPTQLDLFELPKAEYPGDKRPFNFMHDSWHKSENGSMNHFFIQEPDHKFALQDSKAMGMPETKWSMSIGIGDFNQDGWPDVYVANDFGADDFYYNRDGKKFESFRGKYFGTIGKDTYKGMNATVADFDNNGWMDIQISNVHHQLQAEGSLLFYFYPNKDDAFHPEIKDQATYAGALNEDRFGWGAGAADFNNDGWIDMAQANGMVDDMFDKKFDKCPDYWYINEKIARSSPEIHRYINNWGDIRGTCIHGKEKNRLYINRGMSKMPQFIDVAEYINMTQIGNWRGMATADFDNDGRMDLIASSLYRDPLVFKNIPVAGETHSENHWLGLNLESINPKCNRMGIGTKIHLTTSYSKDSTHKKTTTYFETTLVNGFSAQHDPRVHMGLGRNDIVEEIKVLWCGKKEMTMNYSDVKIDSYNKLFFDKLKINNGNE